MGAMETFGQLFSGIGSAFTQGLNMFGQGISQTLSNTANQQRYQEGLDLLQRLQGQQVPWIQQLVDQAGGQYGQNIGQYQNMMSDVLNNLHATRTRALGYLQGAGAQERSDINTGFAGQQAANAANIVNSGMSGTTAGAGTSAGIERQRANAVGSLEERLRQQYLSTDINTSNNIASARERLGGNYFNLLDQNIGRNFSMQMIPQDLLRQFEMSRLGWIGNREDIGPDQGLFAQSSASLGRGFGSSFVRPPDYPDAPQDNSWIGAGIGGAATLGSAGIIAGAL